MNKYETVFIISPNADSEAIERQIEEVQKLITDNGGQVTKVDRWGKRRLAYEVEGHRDGFYVLINFDGDPTFIGILSRFYGLADDVIKSMTLRAEKLSDRSLIAVKDESPRRRDSDDDDDDVINRRRSRDDDMDDDFDDDDMDNIDPDDEDDDE